MNEGLGRLAAMHGIALEYWDQQGQYHLIADDTLVAVLAALGIPAGSPEQVEHAIRERELRDWRRTLPPVYVHRHSAVGRIWVHVAAGAPVRAVIRLEDGTEFRAVQTEHLVPDVDVDGTMVGEAEYEIPAGLPHGWHTFEVVTDDDGVGCPLVVTPDRLPPPQAGWGFMTQVYAMRSADSWGLGDVADLGSMAAWGGSLGAGFVLVNPMHAPGVVTPIEPSPYLPSTRRFFNPIYLRIEALPEYESAPAEIRSAVAALRESVAAANTSADLLDRDAVWQAKRAALELLWTAPMNARRASSFRAFVREQGVGLQDFALWAALSEIHGDDWHEWPEPLQDPRSGAVTVAFAELEDQVLFHSWLQWLMDTELAAAQQQALAAGMSIGIIHDLAVGVHGNGADAWRLGPVLAEGVTVGAPPDMYSQLGQDWAQPPWRPEALAERAFLPYRDMLRTVLRHAGGLRVDHILGLYRQWWVPEGMPPSQGTYIRTDHEAMVGILLLEASRVGACVIGEDLGTLEDWIRHDMGERGILGTGVLWFERDPGGIRPPETWRGDALASVTVHDLPPTAGYLTGAHVRIRESLGLLADPAAEWSRHETELASWRGLLAERGLLPATDGAGTATDDDVIVGLHRLLAESPALLKGVNLPDLVGDVRPQNQPGTHREYPNWQIPMSDRFGRAVLIENLLEAIRPPGPGHAPAAPAASRPGPPTPGARLMGVFLDPPGIDPQR